MKQGLVERLLDALPQTQCTRCGYADCAGYAQALAASQADINQCPPGGERGIVRLAELTGSAVKPLNPAFGSEGPRQLALIDESWCIGCTLCLPVCPTDAILGANKRMHTVIAAHCSGCALCLPVCPVDCISLVDTEPSDWSEAQAQTARQRYAWHCERLQRERAENAQRLEEKAERKLADLPAHSQHTDAEILERKRQVIEAALARSRARQGR